MTLRNEVDIAADTNSDLLEILASTFPVRVNVVHEETCRVFGEILILRVITGTLGSFLEDQDICRQEGVETPEALLNLIEKFYPGARLSETYYCLYFEVIKDGAQSTSDTSEHAA